MNVRLESMCQGDGKIYAQIAIERLSADSIVTLEAHLKDGTEIPAHLLPFDPLDGQSAANFVIIVPHFDEREIMLEFNEYRGADAPLGRAHLTIETNMLTWRTRINSVVKNELIAQMFDIEREYYSDRMHTSFIAAVDDKDEIVVKMLIDLPADRRSGCGDPLPRCAWQGTRAACLSAFRGDQACASLWR